MTNEQIAQNMGVHRDTLIEWRKRFSDISDALKRGRENADYEVENELFQSCHTRTVTVKKPIKVKTVKQDGKKKIEEEKVVYAEEQVVVPANVTAQIFWLKNRRADKWKDKPEAVETQATLADTIQAAYNLRKEKEKNGGDG